MVRIIYKWRVIPANLNKFKEVWRKATSGIHKSVSGARGSVFLQDESDPSSILTIARWDSVEDWQAFWGDSDPQQMQTMRSLGERLSVKVYEEFEDYTV